MYYWIAEFFEQGTLSEKYQSEPYFIIKEEEYYKSVIYPFSCKSKKIVGIVGASDLTKIICNNNEVNIHMLYVHDLFARKQIEDQLLEVVISYTAKYQRRYINIHLPQCDLTILMASLRHRFDWKRKYRINMFCCFGYMPMYELTRQV